VHLEQVVLYFSCSTISRPRLHRTLGDSVLENMEKSTIQNCIILIQNFTELSTGLSFKAVISATLEVKVVSQSMEGPLLTRISQEPILVQVFFRWQTVAETPTLLNSSSLWRRALILMVNMLCSAKWLTAWRLWEKLPKFLLTKKISLESQSWS